MTSSNSYDECDLTLSSASADTQSSPSSPSSDTSNSSSSSSNALNFSRLKQKDIGFRQRIWHHASNVLVGVFIIATVVSNVRAITMAIVSSCARRTQKKTPRSTLLQAGTTTAKVCLALFLLVTMPLLVWGGGFPPVHDLMSFLRQLEIGWDALLHVSIWPLVVVTLSRALLLAYQLHESNSKSYTSSPAKSVAWIILGFFICTVLGSQLQIIAPSWVWNPFLWGRLNVYYPKEISSMINGICLDYDHTNPLDKRDPLCLSRRSWKALSVEALDSTNPQDVDTVMKGVKYAQEKSGGLVVNIMSRDTIDAIGPLRENVEGLLPFFEGKLSVVVFENDSVDGTREAFKEWANQAKGYKVDLMQCGDENPDCKFGLSHRYDATESKEYFKSSAIGKMAVFRQRLVDYVMQSPKYKDYSHMLVMDLDLQVTIAPLGLIHSLGSIPDAAVASAGRQVWPGSLGTLFPPYDFSAFRAVETPANKKLLALHQRFCELMPAGDRWRNQCDAVSPMQLTLVLGVDWLLKDEPYQVESAFNGATLYPLDLIRETNSKYDSGDDGQRCEHIGFNQGLKKLMYINPKWNFHVAPENPGGPTGYRALRNVIRIVFTPILGIPIGVQIALCLGSFVYSVMILGLHVIYPLLAFIGVFGRRHRKDCLPLTEGDYFDFRMPLMQPYSSKRAVKHV